ncbi:MAG: SWIM zinc finger family protein [Rhodospirillaceae bacterium]
MGYGYGGWAPYVPVAERRRKAGLELEKRRKKGHSVSPVVLSGRTIASTFWGKAWCDNLESYRDYENRLPRGRTYVRNGSVVDLQIVPLAVTALVSGSSLYKVSITIAAVPGAQWQSICRDCAGGIDSLVELLQGRLSKSVMERLCRQDRGLFPRPSEITFSCSCPDSASMCKHIAAVLYGVGSRLDHQPELLFRLRSVNEKELLPELDRALPLAKTGPAAGKILESDDLSALFGLELAGEGAVADAAPPEPKAKRPKPAALKTTATKAPAKSSAGSKAVASTSVAPESAAGINRASVATKNKALEKKARGQSKSDKNTPEADASEPQKPGPAKKTGPRSRQTPVDSVTGWTPSDIYNPDE